MSKAPPFRTLHLRYPIDSLEEALAEGIRTGHRAMPEFALSNHQVQDLIAYLSPHSPNEVVILSALEAVLDET